jgi:hypothetical protein
MHIHEQCCDHDVHRLAIADFLVGPAVCRQHSPEPTDTFFALEAWVFGQTPVQVLLDLVYG